MLTFPSVLLVTPWHRLEWVFFETTTKDAYMLSQFVCFDSIDQSLTEYLSDIPLNWKVNPVHIIRLLCMGSSKDFYQSSRNSFSWVEPWMRKVDNPALTSFTTDLKNAFIFFICEMKIFCYRKVRIIYIWLINLMSSEQKKIIWNKWSHSESPSLWRL